MSISITQVVHAGLGRLKGPTCKTCCLSCLTQSIWRFSKEQIHAKVIRVFQKPGHDSRKSFIHIFIHLSSTYWTLVWKNHWARHGDKYVSLVLKEVTSKRGRQTIQRKLSRANGFAGGGMKTLHQHTTFHADSMAAGVFSLYKQKLARIENISKHSVNICWMNQQMSKWMELIHLKWWKMSAHIVCASYVTVGCCLLAEPPRDGGKNT